jgi:hypothetical protein
MIHHGRELLRAGQALLARARLQVALGEDGAEATAREGLRFIVDAMNRLEDTPDFEVAHFRADEGGQWVRRTFGCHLHYENGRYEHRCPVAIGHKRIGMSVGLKNVRRICSVCGQEPGAVPSHRGTHVPRRTFQGGRTSLQRLRP